MHLLKNLQPIPLGAHGTLDPGEWLCHDVNAAQLMLTAARGTTLINNVGNRLVNQVIDASLLFVRSGAIGDLLYLSPALAELKRQNPERRIALSCFEKHHPVVCDLGVELLPYPLPASEAVKFSTIVSLEDLMELDHTRHATDIFASALGVTVTDYKPVFKLNEFEKAWGETVVLVKQKIRVGIQCRASTVNRDYPLTQWMQVFEALVFKHQCEVVLFGTKNQLPPLKLDNVTNLTEQDYSFRQSAAILATCDLFCGVDSSFLPLCHALDIPAVGLYAAFDWKTRTSKAPLTWVINGLGECAPCNWIKHAGQSFPPDKPCTKKGQCVVLASIEPDRIVKKLLSLLLHGTK